MFDLDGFKSVNDEYGHLKGDEVLKALGQSILNSIRKADCFFRWGGDEFLLVLPNTGKEGARKLAEKLRKLASQLEVEPIQGITLSLGIAQLEEGDPDLGIVLKRADEALYRAKKQGKNRVSE
jgi:diguanylate cyclase (GGDEF)-like protein